MRSSSILLLMFLGLIGGWGSALYSVDSVGSTAVAGDGPWRRWDTASADSKGVYAVAHYLLRGNVPPPDALFKSYYAATDSDGATLRAACTYRLEADPMAARWWSFSAGPDNPASAQSIAMITSDTAMVAKDGKTEIVVSPSPSTGNWLAPKESGALVFRMLISHDGRLQDEDAQALPKIQTAGC
jgi:hypothetical protein